ncbi:MAG: hypothetical protein ACKVP4_12855 [Hyphomicrobium sp.]
MSRHWATIAIALLSTLVSASATLAGLPRGAVLTADEQSGDAATGATIAHGNAEITIPAFAIIGRAETIAIEPRSNQIRFSGAATVLVGARRYDSPSITCSLDFETCDASSADQPVTAPAPAEAAAITPQ